MIVFPFGDQRITMRLQCCVELRRLQVREFDPPAAELLVGALGDRALRSGPSIGFGFGSRFQLDRGAQLVDRGDPGQCRVVLIGSLARPARDDPDLIQRQPALPHALGAARKAASRRATVAIVCAFAGDEPVFHATNAATDRAPVAPHNSSRSSSATISTMRPSIALR